MTDKKLSQLPVGTAITSADLFYSAQSLGGGSYTQVQQPASALATFCGGAGSYQPLDGDLTSLAAAAGTNTIYYRSAASTWSPVTISTGLTFTGGALSATGGGTSIKVQRSVTTSPITVAGTDEIINCNISSGSPTCTLPQASTRAGKAVTFKDVGGQFFAHNLTITPFAGDTIEGLSTFVLSNNYAALTLVPGNDTVNTTMWFVT